MSETSFSAKLEAFGSLGSTPVTGAGIVTLAPPISPQERDLAQSAVQDYLKGNHAGCISSLVKLEPLRPKDQKVAVNKAVALFCQSGQKDSEAFGNSLTNILSQVKEDEVDIQCFVHYNHALIFFRNGQFSSTLKHLLKAFNFIESMDEGLSQRVCLLMLEVLLAIGQPLKALALHSYVENQILGSLASQTPPTSGTIATSLQDKSILAHGTVIRHKKEPIPQTMTEHTPPTLPPAFDPEWLQAKLASLRSRAILQARTWKNDVKVPLSFGNSCFNTTSLMLKGHFEYLNNNFNKAARVLNTMSPGEGLEAGDCPTLLWLNNSALAHYSSGRNRLAVRFLTRAMEVAGSVSYTSSDAPMRLVNAQLALNLGLVFLHTGQPEAAFSHLLRAARHFPGNPRIWLRLAECCIAAKHSNNAAAYDLEGHSKDILKGTIACASGRKLILASSLAKNNSIEKHSINPTLSLEFASLCLCNALLCISPSSSATDTNGSQPNSKQLSSPGERSDSHSPTGISQPVSGVATLLETLNAAPKNPQCLPSSPLTDNEVESLRISILASSAYVCLCLGEPVMAVSHAKTMLALPTLPGAFRLLGHLYAAEGLLQLDQISEAIELLQPDTLPTDLSTTIFEPTGMEHEPGAETRPSAPWEPLSLMTARATMLYNLAVAYAIRGNLDKASEAISLVWSCKTDTSKIPVHLIMLSIYVELQQGHVQNARNLLIKHGIPHHQGWGTV